MGIINLVMREMGESIHNHTNHHSHLQPLSATTITAIPTKSSTSTTKSTTTRNSDFWTKTSQNFKHLNYQQLATNRTENKTKPKTTRWFYFGVSRTKLTKKSNKNHEKSYPKAQTHKSNPKNPEMVVGEGRNDENKWRRWDTRGKFKKWHNKTDPVYPNLDLTRISLGGLYNLRSTSEENLFGWD